MKLKATARREVRNFRGKGEKIQSGLFGRQENSHVLRLLNKD